MNLLLSRILSYASLSLLLVFSQAHANNVSNNTYSSTPPVGNVSNNTYSNTPSAGNVSNNTYSNTAPAGNVSNNTYSSTPPVGNVSNNTYSSTPPVGNVSNNTYSSSPSTGSGYQSSTTQPKYYGHNTHHDYRHPVPHHDRHHHDNVSISINLPSNQMYAVANPRPHYHHNALNWISTHTGAPLPPGVVVGGYQNGPHAKLHICRGFYRGGVHPGKLARGVCHIGWGGSEVALTQYEVLTSRVSLQWLTAGYGLLPRGAIEGGYQHDGPLFICQANYHGNVLPGKAYNNVCNIAWHDREIAIPDYSVLTR